MPRTITNSQRIGREIRATRHLAGLSRHDLAQHIGNHESTIARWELGKSQRDLLQSTLDAIAKAGEIPDTWRGTGFLMLSPAVQPEPEPGGAG